jgi:hypothetical protein
MTEREWLAQPRVGTMLYFLSEGDGRERQLRLFTLACCNRVRHLVSEARLLRALDALEACADGRLAPAWLQEHADEANQALHDIQVALSGPDGVLHSNGVSSAACAVLWAVHPDYERKDRHGGGPTYPPYEVSLSAQLARAQDAWEATHHRVKINETEAAEAGVHAWLLADIVGNPFRTPVVEPAWLTSTVVSLARGVYEERAFERMPLLMDALLDAGCHNEAVLEHCRGPNNHVRGCWLIDLLLAKE